MTDFTTRLETIESELNRFLPKDFSADPKAYGEWRNISFGKIDACINESHIEQLAIPCENLVSLGGKRWRPLLLVLCAELAAKAKNSGNDAGNATGEAAVKNAYSLVPLVEFAHTASLIHDDIEDSSEERRGKPAAHITHGIDVAINAASWLYFQAATCIKALDADDSVKNRLYETYLLELRRLHLGQAMDIQWHKDSDHIPTTEEYEAMVRNKTGALSRLAAKIGILSGGGTVEEAERCGDAAADIGVGFQIIDDVTNVTTGNPGKKRGDDIVENKKSFPLIIHLQKHPEDREKISGLFQKAHSEGINSSAVEEVISILEGSESIFEAKTKGGMIVMKGSYALSEFYGSNGTTEEQMIKDLFKIIMK